MGSRTVTHLSEVPRPWLIAGKVSRMPLLKRLGFMSSILMYSLVLKSLQSQGTVLANLSPDQISKAQIALPCLYAFLVLVLVPRVARQASSTQRASDLRMAFYGFGPFFGLVLALSGGGSTLFYASSGVALVLMALA
jgi:hypothetical protein